MAKRSKEQLLQDISVLERSLQASKGAPKAIMGAPELSTVNPLTTSEFLKEAFVPSKQEFIEGVQGLLPVNTMLTELGIAGYEKVRERVQGTPKQRAEKAYGQGIEARIRRQRKFK